MQREQSVDASHHDMDYTNKEDLTKLIEAGFTQREMADKFGVSPSTINRWSKKHGITLSIDPDDYDIPDTDPWKDSELMDLLYVEERISTTEISCLFDCSTNTVNTWLENHGIDRRTIGEAQNVLNSGSPTAATLSLDSDGYMRWTPGDDYLSVHRLLAISEWGTDAVKDMHVHHKNEIPWDNRIENLELLTNSEHQTQHSKVRGLDRLRVAEMYEDGTISTRKLGAMFGVTGGTVLAIHGEYYK